MKSSTENGRKAVRDKIPEIIRNSGRGCATKELSDPGFLVELENKLGEELAEYLQSKELEELAVPPGSNLLGSPNFGGRSKESLEVLRLQKKLEKGRV